MATIQTKLNDFPEFMKSELNRIDSKSQSSDQIEGYVFDGIDGSQMAHWTCHSSGYSPEHSHDFDEYMIVVQGKYTMIIGDEKMDILSGQEVFIPKNVPHAGEYVANTRTIHAFGGKRALGKISNCEYKIRRPRPSEIAQLPAIESDAALLFVGHDIPDSILEETTSLDALQKAQSGERLWVAVNSKDEVLGFALIEFIDKGVHLSEIDVLRQFGQKGIGTALVNHVCAWAKENGFETVTLTTFKNIRWNAPFYSKLGFKILNDEAYSQDIVDIVEKERKRGLHPASRVVMVRELAPHH